MPLDPIGGVQLNDAVVDQLGRVGDVPVRQLEQRRRQRLADRADQIVAVLRVGIGHAEVEVDVAERPGEHFDLDAFERTPSAILPSHAPVAGLMSVSPWSTFEIVRAAVDVLDLEIDAVERVELEVLEA